MSTTSEARIRANQQNALRSTGPRTRSGKECSRANSYRHGMSASVVFDDRDSVEVERRTQALQREMAPKTELGAILVRKIAVTSVVSERATRQEFAAAAERVRHAPERFDAERRQLAQSLLETLGEDPRGNLRQLRAMPEGVELLLHTWRELRDDLTRAEKPLWKAAELVLAANLTGLRDEAARTSRVGVLSQGYWGEADEEDDRRARARDEIVGLIDEAIAELEAHATTLDVELIAIDRAEAGGRALFDGSKEAGLARRYEADASRDFYKAIKEFRAVEAEAAARPAAPPTPAPPLPLGSFREEDEDDEPWPTEMPPEHLRPVSREVLDQVPPGKDAQGLPMSFQPRGSNPA